MPKTAQFPSNWELSTARATFLLQYLISNGGIPAKRLSAVGYGEFRPVASNDTPQGCAANRRVDLVVIDAAAQKTRTTTAVEWHFLMKCDLCTEDDGKGIHYHAFIDGKHHWVCETCKKKLKVETEHVDD